MIYGWKPLTVSYYPVRFDGQWECGSGDVFNLSRDLARPCD